MLFFLLYACSEEQDSASTEILTRPEEDSPIEEPQEEESKDIDQDGFTEEEDCDDWNPNIYPGALEILNNEDDDCDGFIDGDGEYSGSVDLNAIAIYQGEPYFFAQECGGSARRVQGQVELSINCSIDQTQERADMLLGGTLLIQSNENFIFEDSAQLRAEFESVEGEMEWNAIGEANLNWSSFELDQGKSVTVSVLLDALYLDIELNGLLTRQENNID